MGVDLLSVFNHNISVEELSELPRRIDSWKEIEDLLLKELPKVYTQEYIDKQYSNLKNAYFRDHLEWRGIDSSPNEKYFATIQDHWENKSSVSFPTVYIETYFAFIGIRMNTITVKQTPWHKYSNLDDPDKARIIILLNRIIAEKFNQNKIVCFADSSYPTSILSNYVSDGKTVEQIIELGDLHFKNRPSQISEGIQYRYFVDNFSDDLTTLMELDNSEKYWKWNKETGNYEEKIVVNPK